MTPAEAAELLTIAAAFDRRTISEPDAIAWAKALTGLNQRDCAAAIAAHFAESNDYLMPAHVRAGVKRIRDARIRAVPSSELEPADVDPDDPVAYRAAKLRLVKAIADGQPVPLQRDRLPARPVRRLLENTLRRLPSLPDVDPNDESVRPA